MGTRPCGSRPERARGPNSEYQNVSANPLVPCFPRDNLVEMREAKQEFGAVTSSPKCRICEFGDLDGGIIEYNRRCREVADRVAREKYGFEPVPVAVG